MTSGIAVITLDYGMTYKLKSIQGSIAHKTCKTMGNLDMPISLTAESKKNEEISCAALGKAGKLQTQRGELKFKPPTFEV